MHPSDATEPLLWLVPVALALIAVAICTTGLVRGRLGRRWLAAGLIGLPLVSFALAAVVVMDRSRATEFCASCHVMGPVVASVHGADGSLAAEHVRLGALRTSQSCYGCHSGYGIWGDVSAKRAGLMHMLHEVTGRYDLPLRMRAPLDVRACLGCHAESVRFRRVADHAAEGVQRALLAGERGSTGTCHARAHPSGALTGGGSAR